MNAERIAKIDNYLFGEMGSEELELFEQEMLTSDSLIYDVAERENDLVDGYVLGTLSGALKAKFQNSLSGSPERRRKIANAFLLKEYIGELRTPPAATYIPWYRRFGFAFQAPALVSAALALLLVGAIGILVFQNRNLNRQVASLNSTGQNLDELRQREAELQAMLEAERAAGSDLTTDLESERERRTALETELSQLRRQIAITKPPASVAPIVPTIATLILRPAGTRDGQSSVRRLRLDNDEKRVAIKIFLPGGSADGNFSVRINDLIAGSRITPIRGSGGAASITVSAASEVFRNGLNRVEVFDSRSQNILSFAILCERGAER